MSLEANWILLNFHPKQSHNEAKCPRFQTEISLFAIPIELKHSLFSSTSYSPKGGNAAGSVFNWIRRAPTSSKIDTAGPPCYLVIHLWPVPRSKWTVTKSLLTLRSCHIGSCLICYMKATKTVKYEAYKRITWSICERRYRTLQNILRSSCLYQLLLYSLSAVL